MDTGRRKEVLKEEDAVGDEIKMVKSELADVVARWC
jgi:hypothetical protein